MSLPKLYAPVYITFGTLRDELSEGYGVMFDCDADTVRKCRRVACDGGWKWQIVNYYQDRDWDWSLEQDKEILDNYGSDLEFELF